MKKTEKFSRNGALYVFKIAYKHETKALMFALLSMPVTVFATLLLNAVASYSLKMISEGVTVLEYVAFIACIFVGVLILTVTKEVFDYKGYLCGFSFRFKFAQTFLDKAVNTNYAHLEDRDFQKKFEIAMSGSESDSGPIQQALKTLGTIGSSALGLIIYSVFIFSFSSVIVLILLAMSVVILVLNYQLNMFSHAMKRDFAECGRKEQYIFDTCKDFKNAKDIRLFDMRRWLMGKIDDAMIWRKKLQTKKENKILFLKITIALLTFLRNSTVYAFLIYNIVSGSISPHEFVWYFTLVSQYAGYLYGMVNGIINFHAQSLFFQSVKDYLQTPDYIKTNFTCGTETVPDIQFKNVSFRYPGSEKNVLDNISFKIASGKKIALVGINGAGKTTIVKLICGFYQDYEGEILIGGREVRTIPPKEHVASLCAVFQDINILPLSIARNIALCKDEQIDRERLCTVLRDSGLCDKVESLPQQAETLLVESVFDNAVELSGGEMQKLALARALYKDGTVLILDEPTAALDPIAEREMYLSYNKFTNGKTSLFISHRLSSTRFCDSIYVLDNGVIAEAGTHDELMAKSGIYAHMFKVQSQYYKEEGAI